LRDELSKSFPGISINVLDTSTDCVRNADVIVTATNASEPLFGSDDLSNSAVHINGNGRKILPLLPRSKDDESHFSYLTHTQQSAPD